MQHNIKFAHNQGISSMSEQSRSIEQPFWIDPQPNGSEKGNLLWNCWKTRLIDKRTAAGLKITATSFSDKSERMLSMAKIRPITSLPFQPCYLSQIDLDGQITHRISLINNLMIMSSKKCSRARKYSCNLSFRLILRISIPPVGNSIISLISINITGVNGFFFGNLSEEKTGIRINKEFVRKGIHCLRHLKRITFELFIDLENAKGNLFEDSTFGNFYKNYVCD